MTVEVGVAFFAALKMFLLTIPTPFALIFVVFGVTPGKEVEEDAEGGCDLMGIKLLRSPEGKF